MTEQIRRVIRQHGGEDLSPGSVAPHKLSAARDASMMVSVGSRAAWMAAEDVLAFIGGGGVTDHGALTGLADDDHTQYHNDARGDARYWQLSTDLATQVELDAEATTRAAADTALDGRLDTIESTYATDAELAAHVNDTSDAHDGSAVSINPSGLTLSTGVDTQAVIEDLDFYLTEHLADTSDAHDAAAISYAGGSGMSATNLETAVDELATEKANAADLTAHLSDTTDAHDASAISVVDASGYYVGDDVEEVLDEIGDTLAGLGGGGATDSYFGASEVTSPTDNANLYFGHAVHQAPATTAGNRRMHVGRAGTINSVTAAIHATGVAGTAEQIDIYLIVDGASYLVDSVALAQAIRRFTNTSMNSGAGIAVAEESVVEFHIDCPTWATNPTNCMMIGHVFVDR